jgi:hypothetical protein
VVAPVADAVQAGRPVQVHHHVRVGQPQPEDREQALPARQDLGVVVLAEDPDRLVDGARPDVVELGRDQRRRVMKRCSVTFVGFSAWS